MSSACQSTVAGRLKVLLADDPKISFLTGGSLGCTTALSAGHVHGLPVVCYVAMASYSSSWSDAYPGLKDAVASNPYPDNLFVLQGWTDPWSNCNTPRFDQDPSRVWAAAT